MSSSEEKRMASTISGLVVRADQLESCLAHHCAAWEVVSEEKEAVGGE